MLFANYFFYARWDLVYLALIPAASTCDFLIGLGLQHFQNRPPLRRLLVTLSIAINLGLLASVKYQPGRAAVGPAAGALLLRVPGAHLHHRSLPPRRQSHATAIWRIWPSVCFFPTTLAGPITRVSTSCRNSRNRQCSTPAEGGQALFLIGLGLVKKLLIADCLGETLVNRVFDLPRLYSGAEVLIGVYAYALQLYYDFSGYTDIAIGSALLLGIKLPPNFNRPTPRQNIADFWRRWHISFSNWLRDYLYFSLPGLRSRWKIFAYLNLMITMVLGGLWHGASWTSASGACCTAWTWRVTRWWQTWRGNRSVPNPRVGAFWAPSSRSSSSA